MPTLRTRSAKGSELSHAELDANFKRTVSAKTTTYACLVGDNRSVIECNHATIPFTVTLGDAATMAAAETGDYEVTIANIGAATVTVARAGTDTIDGGATSITLPQYSAVTLKVNNAGNGYNTISRTGAGLDADTLDGNEYTEIFDNIYPVGSIHLSTSSTNPGTSLGRGTWTQIASGRTLIGEGTGAGLTARTAGATGGSEDAVVVQHNHGVTDSGHQHGTDVQVIDAGTYGGAGRGGSQEAGQGAYTHSATTGVTIDNEGVSGTDANMQPYLVVYIWERTA